MHPIHCGITNHLKLGVIDVTPLGDDQAKVLCGTSNGVGGFLGAPDPLGSGRSVQLDPDFFAAAAPSAGSGLRRTEPFIDPEKIKDLPIWAFHGDKDGVCPIEKDQVVFDEMKRLGGNMKFTTWAGDGHSVSKKMIIGGDNGSTQFSSDRCDRDTDFMRWLFKQRRLGKQQ